MAPASPLPDDDIQIKRSGSIFGNSIAKGDYTLVVDEEEVEKGISPGLTRQNSIIGYGQGATYPIAPQRRATDIVLNHPALPVLCYCAASILMTVVNKVITYRDFDFNDARKWFPISFLLVSVIYTGSKSLQYLSIPVYTIFKNMTIILIAYGEVLWFGGHVTALTLVSFALMVISSITAASGDISRALGAPAVNVPIPKGQSSIGYAWMIVNCFVSAGYVLAMRKRIKITNFRDWDTMFYNNLLSIPVLVFFSITIEDWSSESLKRNFPPTGRSTLLSAMAFSGAAAVFISYTTAWCVRTTSSTTFSMVGALNKLPVAASGMLFFGDPVTFPSVTSIFLGFVAGLVYAAAKSAQSAKAKLAQAGVSLDGKPR